MRRILFLIIAIYQISLVVQTKISGKVTDKKGVPITQANVYLDGTYDGVFTDKEGKFSYMLKFCCLHFIFVRFA